MAELSEGEREEYDDRLVTCPECRSTFEFEDHSLVDVEALLAARLAPIEALAEEWERSAAAFGPTYGAVTFRFSRAATDLRAALTAPRPVHPAGDEGRQG